MFPWKPKHIQNLCFDINFHFTWWAPLSEVKHFSLKKFSQRIVLFTRARTRGKYGGTTVSGRVATKWCSHLSERKFSLIFVAFQSLKKIFGKLTQSLTICWFLMILWPKQQISSRFPSRFTQGRHRNASIILLLQNMFPEGKFNTHIRRNAQYMALFRYTTG